MEDTPLLRPVPRRAFDLTPLSGNSNASSPPEASPANEHNDAMADEAKAVTGESAPSRTRSVLNLTSSTLFGIYSPSEDTAPEGSGAQTPSWRPTIDDKRPPIIGAYTRPKFPTRRSQHHSTSRDSLPVLATRIMLLFALGVAYGVIIIHLHDDQQLAPVKVEGIERYSAGYLVTWGVAGVLLGTLLPWVDTFWDETAEDQEFDMSVEGQKDRPRSVSTGGNDEERPSSSSGKGSSTDWTPAIRSIGAFVGIAFAIRRLPWQSTLQVSLTLALVNPVLWYLLDRSKPGFILSTIVGLAGTAICLSIRPDMIPSPAPMALPSANAFHVSSHTISIDSLISIESIGVSTWIASVLFCSSVCFGNIGRRLALKEGRKGTPA